MKKPTSLTSLENDEARNLASYALLVLYSWTLLLIFFKNRFNSINKREFYSMFSFTMATLQAFSVQDPFSIHVQNILEMISGSLGNLNCTRNLPFTGSALLNGEDDEAKPFSKRKSSIIDSHLILLLKSQKNLKNKALFIWLPMKTLFSRSMILMSKVQMNVRFYLY